MISNRLDDGITAIKYQFIIGSDTTTVTSWTISESLNRSAIDNQVAKRK